MPTRSTARLSRYDELVLRIVPSAPPAAPPPGRAPPAGLGRGEQHVWIYTRLALPWPLAEAAAGEPGAAPPPEIGGLPLVGHDRMRLPRRPYAEYLGAFYDGDAALTALQRRLFDASALGLRRVLGLRPPSSSRLRIWWANELPELEDVPWESIALGPRRPLNVSIVRGIPGESVPPLCLRPGGPLRVAVIDPACVAPTALCRALMAPAPGLEVQWIEQEDPRRALAEAVRAGVEVIHLVADGSAPLGLDGILEFPGQHEATLWPAELAAVLRGSRVTIVVLTAPETPGIGPSGLPTVYHAFAHVGRSQGAGPTLVAQLAPMAPRAIREVWSAFYARLAETLDVEDAIAVASQPAVTPIVLFLRHRYGRQFSRPRDPAHGAEALDPGQVTTDLVVSGDVLDAARTLQARYASLGRDFPGGDLIDEERERRAALASALDDALSREKGR